MDIQVAVHDIDVSINLGMPSEDWMNSLLGKDCIAPKTLIIRKRSSE